MISENVETGFVHATTNDGHPWNMSEDDPNQGLTSKIHSQVLKG